MNNDGRDGVDANAASPEPAEGGTEGGRSGRSYRISILAACAFVMMAALRLVALDSDAYPRLSWSSGLLTDEGYYIHNARNLVLFGAERTDQFNNMWIMPALHLVQAAVFRFWGVGAVPARMISVICSLVAIPVLVAAVRRALGLTVALYSALLFGLDHVNLLYNRMALMDTPGEMLLVMAIYAWVRGAPREDSEGIHAGWLAGCGAMLALAFVTRSLTGLAIPAFFLAAWIACQNCAPAARTLEGREDDLRTIRRLRAFVPMAAGLGAVIAVYATLWYFPHRPDITRVNQYYLWRQLLPASPGRLLLNFGNAWFGDERGAAPFLMRHSPVQVLLVFGWIVAVWRRRVAPSRGSEAAGAVSDAGRNPFAALMLCWLVCAALFLSVASYAPSRYFLAFYPAMAVIAALSLANVCAVVKSVCESRTAPFFLGAFASYHAGLLIWHHASIGSILAVTITALAGGMLVAWGAITVRRAASSRTLVANAAVAVLLCWAGINSGYLTDWLVHLTYNQRDAGRWLAANLPADSVLIGDVAPGLCLDNGFKVVPVIPGLCNDRDPVEKAAPSPRAIVILDGRARERWWAERYPSLIAPDRRIAMFPRIGRFPVGVYRVEEHAKRR